MKPIATSTAYLLISHGSRDPRPQKAMNRLAKLVHGRIEVGLQPYKDTLSEDRPYAVEATDSVGRTSDSSSERISERTSGRTLESEASTKAHQVKSPAASAAVLVKDAEARQKTGLTEGLTSEHPGIIVETACLELAAVSLSDRICEFAERLIAIGMTELKLVPIFLMSGVHVMEDIPAEIAAARERLNSSLELTLCPHLGSHPNIVRVLEKRLASVPAEGSVLVAHGSRRPKGNQSIQGLAKQLNTSVAYWSTPPDIESQVIDLMQQGCQKLTILPYFLFTGGITDAITHRTEELAERFPKVQFRLLPTLGATAEVAQLTAGLID